MTSPAPTTAKSSSRKARLTAARLAAVQAVYQMIANDQRAGAVVDEFITNRLGRPVDGNAMVMPDGALFTKIVKGVEERRSDLDDLIRAASQAPEKAAAPETLLQAVILCGACELLTHGDIDAPIIIADYLHVTHAFFEQGESRLVNAVLDQVRRAVRD